jgi:hypothetical protein
MTRLTRMNAERADERATVPSGEPSSDRLVDIEALD